MSTPDLLLENPGAGVADVDLELGAAVLAHLERQRTSARALLTIVLNQGEAIRARQVHAVVATAGLMQAELARRAGLEDERATLLARAGERLGIAPGAVTLDRMCAIIGRRLATAARAHSAELRELLAEARREHRLNRALMSQQLSFLDHLLELADFGGRGGYDAAGDPTATHRNHFVTRHRVLDMEV